MPEGPKIEAEGREWKRGSLRGVDLANPLPSPY